MARAAPHRPVGSTGVTIREFHIIARSATHPSKHSIQGLAILNIARTSAGKSISFLTRYFRPA